MVSKKILRTHEAAEYVGLRPSTLEKRRLLGDGPRFVRLGGRAVGYPVEELDRWLESLHRCSSTSEADEAVS